MKRPLCVLLRPSVLNRALTKGASTAHDALLLCDELVASGLVEFLQIYESKIQEVATGARRGPLCRHAVSIFHCIDTPSASEKQGVRSSYTAAVRLHVLYADSLLSLLAI